MNSMIYLAGLALCLAGLWIVVGRIRAAGSGDWTKVTGQVIRHIETTDSTSSGDDNSVGPDQTVYAAVYRFTHEGRDYDVTDRVSRNKPTPAVGASAELMFPNGQPEKAQPPHKGPMFVLAVVLAVFSIVLLMGLLGLL